MARIGIDIGGTFTDLIAADNNGRALGTHKLASTPDDPSRAAMQGLEQLLRKTGLGFDDVEFCCHGTTVATNALLEGKGARTGLITTHGFRDVLHIGRKNRPYNFSHSQEIARQSRPLAPRRWRMTVRERVRAPDGAIETPLDENDVLRAIARLKEEGVEAIAVCCLFSFLNPEHERRIAELARSEFPEAYVTASHELAPLVREYERFSTTAMNAYVGPVTARYVRRFAAGLKAAGVPAQLRLMSSSGGMVAPAEAERRPVNLLLSGPVGALIAGIDAARGIGRSDVITLDVGGTSADIGVAPNGEMRMRSLLDTRVGDYDVMTPMTDIATLGAGGGSIAWLDDQGMFRVGPQSAGAQPGPACYGRGGEQPTVTDALVAAGWYRPEHLAGAVPSLAPDKAGHAIRAHIAEPLGMTLEDAALGIFDIAVNNMAEAMRVASVSKGFDPREFTLVAYGGAGGAFAAPVAEALSIGEVLAPPHPGVGAAGGLLCAPVRYEFKTTLWGALDGLDHAGVQAQLDEMTRAAKNRLVGDGFEAEDVRLKLWAECRYAGQGHELAVETPAGAVDAEWAKALGERFHTEHERAYLRAYRDKPVRVINLGVSAYVPGAPLVPQESAATAAERAEPLQTATCLFPGHGEPLPTAFYHRASLQSGHGIAGPAIVEQTGATTAIPPGWSGRVDNYGNLLLTRMRTGKEGMPAAHEAERRLAEVTT
ncbi:hydantoinase/oxoprolinase family protein [Candidatus Foliamicus sp.]